MSVPAALENEKLCILHFTMEIERRCAEMRRETAIGRTAGSTDHGGQCRTAKLELAKSLFADRSEGHSDRFRTPRRV